MTIQKRFIYMLLGGFLALSLFAGAFAVFAQTGDGAEVPEAETEEGEGQTEENGDTDTEAMPGWGRFHHRGFAGTGDHELLAEALGISVEELDAAFETARTAAIEQALEEGLLTQEQADELLSRDAGFHKGFMIGGGTIDFQEFLAEALDISVEELQAAHNEVFAARLAEMVEAGMITQEQADLIVARKAVQDYIDTEAISEMLQSAYEDAIAQALADGVITQEQADQMLEDVPNFGGFGFGMGGPHGSGGFGRHHGRGGGPGGFGPGAGFGPTFQAPAFDSSSGV